MNRYHKIIFFILLSIFFLVGLVACGKTEEEKSDSGSKKQLETPIGEETDATDAPLPTATSTPTPTPVAESVKLGRLLLNLGENKKEFGTADVTLKAELNVNLTDELEKQFMEFYPDIEMTNRQEMNLKGHLVANRLDQGGRYDLGVNIFGYEYEQRIEEYWETATEETCNYYYYDTESDGWYLYEEDGSLNTDLTDTIGIYDFSSMSTENIFEEIDMKLEADRYVVDGLIKFRRFFDIFQKGHAGNFVTGIPQQSDDLMMKVHMEFNKSDTSIRLISMYLMNPQPLTMKDEVQFASFSFDVDFNLSPDGPQNIVPFEARNSATLMQ